MLKIPNSIRARLKCYVLECKMAKCNIKREFDRNSFCDYANSIKQRIDTWNCGWGISWWWTWDSCKNQTVKTLIHTGIKVKLNQDLKRES